MKARSCLACGSGPPVRDHPDVRYGGVEFGPLCRPCERLWLLGHRPVTPPRWVYVPGTPGMDYQPLPAFRWVLDGMVEYEAIRRPKGEKP